MAPEVRPDVGSSARKHIHAAALKVPDLFRHPNDHIIDKADLIQGGNCHDQYNSGQQGEERSPENNWGFFRIPQDNEQHHTQKIPNKGRDTVGQQHKVVQNQ